MDNNTQEIFKGVPTSIVPTECADPCTSFGALFLIAKNVMVYMLVAGTIIAIVGLVWSGFQYITSGGEKPKADAKKLILSIFIGYGIILGSWIGVNYILGALLENADRWSILGK